MSDERPVVMLGVTGSIAAYKAAELVRLMMQAGWDVHVLMTRHACEFVGPLTFLTLSRNPVASEMFGPHADWHPAHIDLADRARAFVVAPCTGNMIAKMAHGLADDMLSSTVLATEAPVVIAPAMNGKMWLHAATQDNVRLLKSRGVHVVEPATGDLACGYEGVGKMAEPPSILDAVRSLIAAGGPRRGEA